MGYLEIFNFQVFGDFIVVFITDFWFNSIMDREHFKICFIAFKLLRPALQSNIWSILENVPCALEKTVF